MKLSVTKDDCACSVYVDRDSVLAWHGRQGFSITIGEMTIHFEDELDAERVAEMILVRLGRLTEGGKR
jgi:hypothetical protein